LHFSKLESLGTLAGGIAHDFNNILTVILGNISLAMMDQTEAMIRMRLTAADRACHQARTLAQQLLTFARGGTPIKELVSVAELVSEAGYFACTGSNVKCDVTLPNGLWAVEADPGQISLVFQNLVINAIQAMPTGGTVEVTGKNLEITAGSNLPLDPGNYVNISLHDRGLGIPAEYLSQIFDPYFTTKQRGSGLALAKAHSIL
jgi:signal transduction histidine kinase